MGSFQLPLINVTVGVADDGRQSVVRYIDALRQRNHLRAKLGHASLHGLLHDAVGARGQEACVIGGGAILKQLLKTVDLANQLHELIASGISERTFLAGFAEDLELQVPEVRLSHVILGGVEQLIILDLSGSLGCIVIAHS